MHILFLNLFCISILQLLVLPQWYCWCLHFNGACSFKFLLLFSFLHIFVPFFANLLAQSLPRSPIFMELIFLFSQCHHSPFTYPSAFLPLKSISIIFNRIPLTKLAVCVCVGVCVFDWTNSNDLFWWYSILIMCVHVIKFFQKIKFLGTEIFENILSISMWHIVDVPCLMMMMIAAMATMTLFFSCISVCIECCMYR